MPPEAYVSGFREFRAAYASLLESLYFRSNATRWKVTHEEFAAALHRSAAHRFGAEQPTAEAAESYFQTLHLEDLALVCALRRGSESAWEQFVKEYRPVLQASARAIVGACGEARARELADSLYAELYGLDRSGSVRKNPLLDYFHGRSKLTTWLRAVLAQRHVDALRVSQRVESLDEGLASRAVSFDRASSAFANMDPDRARLLPRLAAAISEALGILPPSDRLLLSLYYVQGLTLAQIAGIHDVHEATASRRLQNIRSELRERVKHVLGGGSVVRAGHSRVTGLSPAEIRRCLEYATEDWAFDLSSMLAEKAAPGPAEGE